MQHTLLLNCNLITLSSLIYIKCSNHMTKKSTIDEYKDEDKDEYKDESGNGPKFLFQRFS